MMASWSAPPAASPRSQDTGSGAVTLMGTAGSGQDNNIGVVIEGTGAKVQAGSGTTSGLLTITGLANSSGVTGDFNQGVTIYSSGQAVSGSGGMQVTGTASSGGVDDNYGLSLSGGSLSTTNAGTITLQGTAHGTGMDNQGFSAFNTSSITSTGGNISITGNSTAGGTSFDTGVTVDSSTVSTTGTGTLTLMGTSAGGSDYLNEGVSISFGASLSTGSGLISITGNVTGSAPNGGIGVDISPFAALGNAIGITSTSGSITINGTGGTGNTGSSLDSNPYAANAGIRINDTSTLTSVGLTLSGSGSGTNATGVDISPNLGTTKPNLIVSGVLTVTSTGGLINYDASSSSTTSNTFTAPTGTSSTIDNAPSPISLSGTGADFTVNPGGGALIQYGFGCQPGGQCRQWHSHLWHDGNQFDLGHQSQRHFRGLVLNDAVSGATISYDISGNITLGTTTATTSLTLTGNTITQSGPLTTALLLIPSAGQVTLTNTSNNITALGDIAHTAALSIFTDPGLTIGGVISGNSPVLIQEMGNDLTIGPGGEVEGSTINLVTNHYLVNDSTLGSGAIQPTGNYYIYDSDPTFTVFNGITPDFTQFNTVYPASTFPSGNGIFYAVANAGQVGNFNPSSPTSPPSTDGDGSNTTPPANTTQQNQVAPQQPPPNQGAVTDSGSNPPPFDFQGNGIADQIGTQNGGLADSSGNSGQVGSGDTAQLNNGELINVANPAAAGALNQALSGPVRNNLADALKNMGEWTPAGAAASTDNNAGGKETTLGGGDVVEIGDNGVKTIPLSQAPQALQNALGNGVEDGLKSGSGH